MPDFGEIRYELVGRRYLRLDRTIDGWARLSPSIRREFLTYTVFGGPGQEAAISERVKKLSRDGDRISRAKSYLARDVMASVLAELGMGYPLAAKVAFIIAGDVTYGMAHAVPRPESSTGQLVRGSDLDVIAVAEDDFPAETLQQLDAAIYRKKHYLLVSPSHHEEIDYVVNASRRCVSSSVRYVRALRGLEDPHEGEMLCGSREVFDTIKMLVEKSGVPGKLAELERQAAHARAAAEEYLLSSADAENAAAKHFNHFYSRDEHDEIY